MSWFSQSLRLIVAIFASVVLSSPALSAVAELDPEVFDWQYYVQRYSDLAGKSEAEAQTHWLNKGAAEGRQGSLLFWSVEYFELYPSVKTAVNGNFLEGVRNYVTYGRGVSRAGLHALTSAVFEYPYYVNVNIDLVSTVTDLKSAKSHWLQYGRIEGRRAAPLFAVSEYRTLNPDLAAAGTSSNVDAVQHYSKTGSKEGRIALFVLDPQIFNVDAYKKYNTLNFASLKDAQLHWITTGLPNGLKSSPDFSVKEYVDRYDDLRSVYSSNYAGAARHYYVNGRRSGRLALASSCPASWYTLQTQRLESPATNGADDRTESFTTQDGRTVIITVKAPSTGGTTIAIPAPADGEDSTPIFAAALARVVAENVRTIELAADAVYVFKTAGSYHVEIKNLSDLTIKGNGATLVFNQPKNGLGITDSKRIKLENFTVDYDGFRIASPGVIEAANDGSKQLRVNAAYPVAGTIIRAVTEYDTTARLWTKSPKSEIFPKPESQPTYAGNQVYTGAEFANFNVGTKVLVRHHTYSGNSLRIGGANSEEITIKQVTVLASPGMSLYVQGLKRGLLVSGCVIRAKLEDPTRFISSAADGLHLRDTGGDIIVENNNISHQGDDGINLASGVTSLATVNEAKDEVQYPVSGNFVDQGDMLALFNTGLGFLGSVTVSSVTTATVNGASHHKVKFSAPVPNLDANSFVRNMSRSGNRYIIRNNVIRNNRARGLLVQTANGLVENNVVEGPTMAGMLVITDASFWFEGFGPSNLIVRGNTVRANGWVQTTNEGAGINLIGKLVTGPAQFPVLQNITVTNNTIENVPGPCMLIASTKGVVVKDNVCKSSNLAATSVKVGTASMKGSVVISQSRGLKLIGNTRTGASSGGIEIDLPSTGNLDIQTSY